MVPPGPLGPKLSIGMRTLRALLVLILTVSLIPGWIAAAAPSCRQQSAASDSAGGDCEGCNKDGGGMGCVAVSCPAPCTAHHAGALTTPRASYLPAGELAAAETAAAKPLPRSIPPALPPPR